MNTKEILIRENQKTQKQVEFCKIENNKFAKVLVHRLENEKVKGETKELLVEFILRCVDTIYEVRTCTKGVITQDHTIYFLYETLIEVFGTISELASDSEEDKELKN